jgi:hypothetical protein
MKRKIVIDLKGPDGNAFALLGYVKGFADKLGLCPIKICEEMTASDYDNLVAVFEKHFGSIVKLEK